MTTIKKALILAGLILAVSYALAAAERSGWIAGDTMERAQGVVAGLVLMVFANLVPKTLEPLSRVRCDPARAQALQRFTGWTLALAGLGYAVAWLALPFALARPVAIALVAGGLILVFGRVAWTFTGGSDAQPPIESGP